MVNEKARAEASSIIRRFLSGTVDNFALADNFPRNNSDPALNAIQRRLWFHYDDVKQHQCEFPLNSPEEILFRRCALFLDTTLEYEWPRLRGHNLAHPIVAIFSGDLFRSRAIRDAKRAGEYAVWPFFRASDMANAKSRHGQNDIHGDEASWELPTGISGKLALAFMVLETLSFLGGLAVLLACFVVRSGTLLASGLAGIALYLVLFGMQRFWPRHKPDFVS